MSTPFLDALHSGRVLLMDGAMGTELQRAGARDGECLELWNVAHVERVWDVYHAYSKAGADCLVTNTFQAGKTALRAKGVSETDWVRVNKDTVEWARHAGRVPTRFVLGSIGPPAADLDADAAAADCLEQMQLLARADGVLLETQGNLEFVAAVLRHKASAADLPLLLVSFAYSNDGRDVLCRPSWATPDAVARFADKAGPQIAALGVNCGRDMGMNEVIDVIRRYRRATALPLFARPNAGTPTRTENGWQYPLRPHEMAGRLPDLLAAGVNMVGGCCGTTPAHVDAMRLVVESWNAPGEDVKA